MSVIPTTDSAFLLKQRYAESANWQPDSWNELLALLLQHRSVRHYLPQEIPSGALESAIAAAQSAATSSNLQAWSVVAVTDPERKARLSTLSGEQKHITQAPLFLVWLADLSRITRIAESYNLELGALPFIEALLIAVIDAALAAQNAALAFESLGLGICYIGGIRNNIELVAEELTLPSHVTPVFGMTVGFPDLTVDERIKPRLPQDVVLHHETYSIAGESVTIAQYDDRVRQFFADQGQTHAAWSEIVCKRLKSPRSLTGRDRLREALIKFGFDLK